MIPKKAAVERWKTKAGRFRSRPRYLTHGPRQEANQEYRWKNVTLRPIVMDSYEQQETKKKRTLLKTQESSLA